MAIFESQGTDDYLLTIVRVMVGLVVALMYTPQPLHHFEYSVFRNLSLLIMPFTVPPVSGSAPMSVGDGLSISLYTLYQVTLTSGVVVLPPSTKP